MNETDKLIEEQWKTLPPSLQQAIKTVPWKTFVQGIGKENALDAEQIVSLEQETMFIIYAFEPPEDYIGNLMREVGISEDAAYTIAEAVANKIFDPISKKNEEVLTVSASMPEIAPEIHPMIEEGEKAHDVPHIEKPQPARHPQPARQDLAGSDLAGSQTQIKPEQPNVSIPDYRYDGGKDPYREPLG